MNINFIGLTFYNSYVLNHIVTGLIAIANLLASYLDKSSIDLFEKILFIYAPSSIEYNEIGDNITNTII